MQILIVSATKLEIGELQNLLPSEYIDFLITGAGTPSTILHLTTHLCNKKYNYIINIGIGGSYSKDVPIGTVVEIDNELFADLGIEATDGFKPLSEFDFCPVEINNINKPSHQKQTNLIGLSGYTFNTVHGQTDSIKKLNISSGIESMEGAAVKLTSAHFNIPCIQLRAISNYVEKRDKNQWDIPTALRCLHKETVTLVNSLLKGKGL